MLRFSPLLPPQISPVQKPPSPLSVATEDPMTALTALTNSYHHQNKSSSKVSRLPPPGSGDGCNSPPAPLLPASGPMAVWVQTLSPSSISFNPLTKVLCFLKYFFPPPVSVLTTSPLLTNLQMGTLTYVGWVSVPLDAPLNCILPELRSRASLPADSQLLVFEEGGTKELRSLTHYLERATVRESLCADDGMETFILVYQRKPLTFGREGVLIVEDELATEDINNQVVDKPRLRASSTLLAQHKRPFLPPKRRLISRPRFAALKLVSRSKRIMRSQPYSVGVSGEFQRVFKSPLGINKKPTLPKTTVPVVTAPPQIGSYSPFLVKSFYHEILTRVLVEFYELVFPWHMLTGLRSVEPSAAVTYPPQMSERILLPGVPLSGGSRTYKTSLILEQVIASIQGPGFSALVSPNQTYKHLVALVASHFSAPVECIQLFTVSTGPTVSGEREFTAIPSTLEWKAKDIFVQHSLSSPRHKVNHGSGGRKSNASAQIFFQRLSIPTERLEYLCQLRCVFVDTRKVREVVRLLLIVPHHWTVRQILQLAKEELKTIGCLTNYNGDTCVSSDESTLQEPVLRMFETLNTWIIQQFSLDEVASRLQVTHVNYSFLNLHTLFKTWYLFICLLPVYYFIMSAFSTSL